MEKYWNAVLQSKVSMYEKTQKEVHTLLKPNRTNNLDWTEIGGPGGKIYRSPLDRRCREEHQADMLQTTYLDSVFYSYCKNCGIKIVFEKVPGSFPKVKITQLLADAMVGKPLNKEELLEVRATLRMERELLEKAESNYRLLMAMIQEPYEEHSEEGVQILPPM